MCEGQKEIHAGRHCFAIVYSGQPWLLHAKAANEQQSVNNAAQLRETFQMNKILAFAAMAMALLVGLPQSEAEARPNGGGGARVTVRSVPSVVRAPVVTRSVGIVGGRPTVVQRHHRHVRSGVYFAAPVVVGTSCGWLKAKAVNTGSRYWWHRYRECRGWE
jgi:hypothetical protein